MPTMLRNVRVADPLWNAASEHVVREGRSVSAVVRDALRDLIADDVHEPCGHPYRDHSGPALDCPDELDA